MEYTLKEAQLKHLETLVNNPSKGHIFSYYLCSKLLKDNLVFINDFYIDGGNDRGIDFILIRLNNKEVTLDNLINSVKSDIVDSITISIFQCKNEKKSTTSFSENEFSKVNSFLSSIVRCCKNKGTLETNKVIANSRAEKFANALIDLFNYQHNIKDINFEYNYINTAIDLDEQENDKVKNDMGENIDSLLKDIFTGIKTSYEAYSKLELNSLYVKFAGYRKELKNFYKNIEDEVQEGVIGLINAKEFFKCITDNDTYDIESYKKEYNEIIFDNNVRSFLGKNKINKSIMETCKKLTNSKPERKLVAFWAKNNGITILCQNYELNRNGVLIIYDLKIINGLQTITSVLEFICQSKTIQIDDLEKIVFHVKIIKKQGLDEKEIQDIIIATNSQTQVKYQDLISINGDLRKLEFKLFDEKIDYIRKKNQPFKQDCALHIKQNELLQLIITCFKQGPSAAKNNLEPSLYPKNKNDEKELIDLKPYWQDEKKFNKLIKSITVYDALKNMQTVVSNNDVLRYAKLHTTYCLINVLNAKNPTTDKSLNKAIEIMDKVFKTYMKGKPKTTIEKLSKAISVDSIKSIIKSENLLKNK